MSEIENVDLRADIEAGQEENNEENENEIVIDWSEEEAAEAEAMGWIPPERAGKIPEGKKFVKPREFMERNPLYKKMKLLESSFSQLNSHYQKVSENEHKKAEAKYRETIERLEQEKIEALDQGDSRRVVDIDKEIRATEKPEKPETQEKDPVFESWVKDNNWYENDAFLRVEADRIGERYLASGLTGQALLDATKDHLTQIFPDKFGNKERSRAPAVEGATAPAPSSSSAKKNFTEKDLTQDERMVFKNFTDMGVFKTPDDKAKYIREVIELRD